MADLADLLRQPVMIRAFEIVKAESVGLPDPIPGIDYQQHVAVCGAFTAGAFRALERLESLTRPVGIAPGNLPRQTQYDAAAKERMRGQGLYSDKQIEEIRE